MNQSFLEIERKYLIDHCPLILSDYKSIKIQQAYLSLPKELNTLRVRNYGGELTEDYRFSNSSLAYVGLP